MISGIERVASIRNRFDAERASAALKEIRRRLRSEALSGTEWQELVTEMHRLAKMVNESKFPGVEYTR